MCIEEHHFLPFSLQIKSELCIFKKRYPVLPDRDLTNPYENVTLNKLSAGRLLPVYSAGLVQRLLVAHAARHTRGKSCISLIRAWDPFHFSTNPDPVTADGNHGSGSSLYSITKYFFYNNYKYNT